MSETKNEVPTRSEIEDNCKWDLSSMYSSIEEWEKDFLLLDSKTEDFLCFHGKLSESATNLSNAFKALDSLYRTLEKLYVFSHLESDQDINESEPKGRHNRVSAKYAEIQGKTAWFSPEVMEIDEKTIEEFRNSDELSFYRRSIDELLRNRPHTLSAKEERLLGMASDLFSTPSKTFSMLNNADMKFPVITDDGGVDTELSHGNYIKFLESENREVRKSAFNGMYDTFNQFKNTLATTLEGTVKTHCYNAKIRNHKSAINASLHPDSVPVSVYENLVNSVNANLSPLHKYYKLRGKVLNLDKIDMYDVYNPLMHECKMDVKWDDACKWVKESLKPMGADYCSKLEKAFTDGWIDIYENKGKRSGAYSSGCYDSNPYILLNYTDTLKDVFTLAHELGHSMHSFYSRATQEYHYADYKIFVAEVASTTNELLLHDYLIKTNEDADFKIYLLNQLVDNIRGTVYRQTMFAEFEKLIHDKAEQGIPLTPDELCTSYFELNSKYHGEFVAPDQKIEMEWARIPHFYYNFYVYKYATGLSAAVTLSENILSGDQSKLDAYLGFLKAGSTKDVLDIMQDAGVDLRTPAPVDKTLGKFSDTVDELAKLLKVEL